MKCVGFLLRRVDCNDGVSSHCETLIRGLKDNGIRVVLLTGEVNWDAATRARFETLKSLCAVWVQLPLPQGRWAFSWRAAKEIANAVRGHNITVLHLHGVALLPLARAASLFAKVPLVVTAHPSGTSELQPRGSKKTIIRLARPMLRKWILPERAIAISSELQNWFVDDLGMSPSRVDRIYNGVDIEHFQVPTNTERLAARQKFALADSDFVCSLVGRLDPVKRHDVLLKAAHEVSGLVPNFRVLIAGGGPEGPNIERMIRARTLENVVTLCGYVSDPRDVYWASDCLVLPSDREGFGLVTAEAMLCGVIPLRTPTAGARDQIDHGKTGFIFPFGNSMDLASYIQRIAINDKLGNRMAQGAVVAARRKFDSVLMVRSTIALYRTLTFSN